MPVSDNNQAIADLMGSVQLELDKKAIINNLVKNSTKPKHMSNPNGWSSLANAPYFKEKYALKLKPLLDLIIQTKQVREIPYSAGYLKPSSLHNKILQAFLYLCEHLDDENKTYTKLRHLVNIRKGKLGIIIELKDTAKDSAQEEASEFVSREVEAKKQTYSWRERLDEYIENGEMETSYEDKKVTLSADDIADLEAALSQIPNLMYKIEPNRIKLVKTMQETSE